MLGMLAIKYQKKPTAAQLEDKFPHNFLYFSLQSISANYGIDRIEQRYPNATEVTAEVLNIKLSKFNNCQHHQVF